MDCHKGHRDAGFFRDDPVFRGRAEGANFFQSGRHKGEEHFWRNIHRGTPHRPDDGYTDNYDGYDSKTGRFYNRDRRGNRYLSGASTSTNQTDSSEEELHRDLRLTKEKTMEDKPMEEEEEDEEEKKKKENEKKKEEDTQSVYAPSAYAPSTFGGSQYEDGVWPRRRKSFFKICNAAPTFYPNLSR